jgi:hypothetical protein
MCSCSARRLDQARGSNASPCFAYWSPPATIKHCYGSNARVWFLWGSLMRLPACLQTAQTFHSHIHFAHVILTMQQTLRSDMHRLRSALPHNRLSTLTGRVPDPSPKCPLAFVIPQGVCWGGIFAKGPHGWGLSSRCSQVGMPPLRSLSVVSWIPLCALTREKARNARSLN